MKKPSLNILHKDLLKILKKKISNSESQAFLDYIIREAEQYPLRRKLIFTSKKTQQKLERVDSSNVELFNRILNSERSNLQHRGMRQILKTDRNYLVLCDTSRDAQEFCEVFNLELIHGFKIYCELGLKKMGRNYRLNKFKNISNWIFEIYEKKLIISEDEDPELTIELSNYYYSKAGLTDEIQLRKSFETFSHDFVFVKQKLEDFKTDFKTWIDSQFKGLEFLDIIPEPYQLHTEEAEKRFLKHAKITTRDSGWRLRAKQLRDEKNRI